MNAELHIEMSESFKDDLREYADQNDQSMAEYLREAARRQMQYDIAGEHRLAGAEPRSQPDDAGDIEDTL